MKTRFWMIGLLVVLAMAFGALQVVAQDDSTAKIEFTGEITAIEDDGDSLLLTISELAVDATDAETDLLPFEVGMLVKVEGTLDADGTVLATEIYTPETDDMLDDSGDDMSDDDMVGDDSGDDSSGDDADSDDMDDPDDLELVGTLDSLDGDTAVVSGLSFDMSEAEIAAMLVVGDMVKVEADYDVETGVWVASELKLYTGDMTEDDASNDDMSNDDVSGDDSSDDSSACMFEVKASSASLRGGPGTGYAVAGYAYEDDKLPVMGIDETGSWVNVSTSAGDAWIAISTGELDDCSGLPVSDMPFQDDHMSGDDDSHDDNDMYDDDSSHDGDDDDDMHDDDSSHDDDSDDDHSDDQHEDNHSDDDHSDDHDD